MKKFLIFTLTFLNASAYNESDKQRLLNSMLPSKNCACENCDLEGLDIKDVSEFVKKYGLKNCRLSGSNLKHANFSGINLNGILPKTVDLTGLHLEGADLSHANFEGSDLSGAFLDKAKAHRTNLRGTKFVAASARSTDFTEADLENSNFLHATLTGSPLENISEGEQNYLNANTRNSQKFSKKNHTKFHRANLKNVVFKRANLQYVDFTGAKNSPLNPQYQDKLMNTQIVDPAMKHCCTIMPDGKTIFIYNEPQTCPYEEQVACNAFARENNYNVIVIDPTLGPNHTPFMQL
ncbi:hypothetical protein A3F66_00085 [candidate division TM6 bacterium RIFCSPHIGHO2_12_FULL_32_22]|nr:MAG: hypothetical protein A3F66_00085 [candidate division TM6 bacterium RIFCSPHIGHO2_12_FULL_32_22]